MPLGGDRRARRRGMLMGAAIASSRNAKRQAAAQPTPAPAAPAPQPAAAPADNVADQLKQLADLRDQGILTEEEFAAKKKQLLNL